MTQNCFSPRLVFCRSNLYSILFFLSFFPPETRENMSKSCEEQSHGDRGQTLTSSKEFQSMTPTRCHLVRFLSLSLTHHCLCHLMLYDLLLLNESISRWCLQFRFQLASLLKAYLNISKPEKFISHTHRNASMLTLRDQVCGSYLWEGPEEHSFQFTA